jgi:hypothetical protein
VEDGTHDTLYRPGTHYHALWQRADTRIARLVGTGDPTTARTPTDPAIGSKSASPGPSDRPAGEQDSDPLDPSLL